MSVDIKKEIDNLYLTSNCNYDFNNERELLEKFGKQMWNAALDWAVNNAEIKIVSDGELGPPMKITPRIDSRSILKGKIK